jgi:hypothetical protein
MSSPARGYNYTNINTATTTVVKATPGVLKRVIVGKSVASGVITIYVHASGSGTIILKITHPGTLLQTAYSLEVDARFFTGCTVITGSTDDITLVWA